MKKRFILCLALSLAVFNFVQAVEKEDTLRTEPKIKRQVLTKKVVGEVAGISSNFIAVDYQGTYELAIPMDKNTKGSHKDLKKINVGDLVAVTYEETVEIIDGKKTRSLKRLAKVVEFRQAAKVSPEITGVFKSQE